MSLGGCKQTESGNVTLWSTAQLQTATQRDMHWGTYGGCTFLWTSCRRNVDALISASCNCACLWGIVLTAAEAADYTADSLVYSCCSFIWTPIIHIWSTFDSVIWPNTSSLFRLLFGLSRIWIDCSCSVRIIQI